MEKKRGGFVSGALALTLSALMVKALGVVYKVPLSYILGDEGMGYFNSAYSVYGFFYILASAGIPKAIAMLTTESGALSGAEYARRIYFKSLKLFACFGIVITALFIILSRPLSTWVGNSNSYATMVAIAPSIFFISLSGVSRGYLNGRERLIPIAISQLIEAASKLIVGILFAYVGMKLSFSLPMISSFTVLGITLGSFFSSLYLYIASLIDNKDEKTGQNIQITTNGIMKRIFKIALPITISSSVISIANIIDLGITMRALGGAGYTEGEASALYGNYTTLAVPMFNLVTSVLAPISVACLPRLMSARLKREYSEFNDVLFGALKITLLVSSPCAMIFILYPFDILDMLFSSQASAVGAELLSALAVSVILVPILTVINTALESAGKIRLSACSLLLGAIAKVLLSWCFIGKLNLGILGAPISTVLSYGMSLLTSIGFLKSVRGVCVNQTKLLRPIISCVFAYASVFLVSYSSGALRSGALATIICISVSTLLYLCLEFSTINVWVLALKKSENKQKIRKPIIE